MKTIVTFLIIMIAAVARADIPPGWSTDVSASSFKQQPGLLFFTASWCGPCKMMTQTTLSDPAVKKAIAGINHVAVDIDEHPELAAEYSVEAVPTFIMLSSGGAEVERSTGYQAAADFLAWLNGSIDEAKKATAERGLANQQLAAVDSLLVGTGSDSLAQAAAKLYPLCEARDPVIVKAAEDRLKAIADRQPAALLDGLNDGELATRIRVANVLEGKLAVAVDPWSDPADRAKAVAAAREQMTPK